MINPCNPIECGWIDSAQIAVVVKHGETRNPIAIPDYNYKAEATPPSSAAALLTSQLILILETSPTKHHQFKLYMYHTHLATHTCHVIAQ